MTKSALCIGINDYPGTNSDLSGCVNDARDWEEALRRRGFKTSLLLDSSATKANIVARMQEIVASTRYRETSVIQYSGHGTNVPDLSGDEPDKRDEALCPHDIADAQLILDDEIHQIFSHRKFGARIVLISDSCHSGTVHRLHSSFGDAKVKIRFLPPETFLRGRPLENVEQTQVGKPILGRFSNPVSVLMSGCEDWEYSYDAWFQGRANGAFSYVALKALALLGSSGTYLDWWTQIRSRLPSRNYPQTPRLSGTYNAKRWKVLV